MAIDPMYPAKAGSPKTMLAEAITNGATSMTVVDSSVLPPAPNICVIGEDENAEVVGYTGINGNTITGLLRGLQGSGTTPSPWIAGTAVARNFTSFDHDRFIDNINDLSANLALKAPIENPAFTGIPTAPTPDADDDSTQIATTEYVMNAISGKQDTLTFDNTPTASSTNPVKSGGVKTALDTLDDAKVSKSGDTMTGTLKLNDANLYFQRNSENSGQIYSSSVNAFVLRNFPSGSTYSEFYYTPTPDTNLDGNKIYSILTTKNVVKIEQGGTGATKVYGSDCAASKLFPNNLSTTIDFLTGMTQGWGSTGYVKLPLPVALGGTGGTDSDWVTVTNSTVFTGNIYVRKIGKFVMLKAYQIKLKDDLTSGSGITLCTLGTSYHPDSAYGFAAGTPLQGLSVCTLSNSGVLKFYKVGSETYQANANIYFSIMYMTA